jgi:tetratricopeptide (TPR) repeat protein
MTLKGDGTERHWNLLREVRADCVGNLRVICKLAFIFLLFGLNFAAALSDDAVRSISIARRLLQYDQAFQLAHARHQKSPSDPRILTLERLALSGTGKKNDALADFDAAIKTAPGYFPALEAAGELEYNAGSDRAVPLPTKFLRLRPDDPTAHAMLAAIA